MALVVSAVSLGKSGPDLANLQFAVDSSGTGPPPPQPTPPATPPAATTTVTPLAAPEVKAQGKRRTRARRPVFTFSSVQGASFFCRIGTRETTKILPCSSPFRAPDLGPGRHVLVVQAVDPNGNSSGFVKYAYFVAKPAGN